MGYAIKRFVEMLANVLLAYGLARLHPLHPTLLRPAAPKLLSMPNIVATANTAALYTTMDKLIRSSKRNHPSVRALSKRWTTMSPGELVENALVIGKSLVGNFSQGCALLAEAEDTVGVCLSQRAYAALMLLGQAEQKPLKVLGLLSRLRAHNVKPSPVMLRTSMVAAAELKDWGAVSRLFSEYAGSDSPVEALELIGPPQIIDDFRASFTSEDDATDKLTPADVDALRLALRAHCARGDTALVVTALRQMRKL